MLKSMGKKILTFTLKIFVYLNLCCTLNLHAGKFGILLCPLDPGRAKSWAWPRGYKTCFMLNST